jgi:prephenate dehydrogenase
MEYSAMRRVAIFGVGLIGGSFALALRKAGFDGEIVGVSSRKTIEAALALGVVDRGADAEEAVEQSDLIYLAQPIATILETLAWLGPRLRSGTIVTDAGSTKKRILDQACCNIQHSLFIGGHPMAGKERSGVQEAEAGLFEGRPYVLCPLDPKDTGDPRFEEFRDWIVRIGARPIVLDADEHDRLVAFTSHVPQLISTALASILADVEGAGAVAGPGVMGLTRLAVSPFSIWRDIFKTNEKHIAEALARLIAKLKDIQECVSTDALAMEFERAAAAAKALRKKQND